MSYTEKMILKLVEEILPEMPEDVEMTKPESRFFQALMEKVALYVPDELRVAVNRCFYIVIADIENSEVSTKLAHNFIMNMDNLISRYREGWN